MRKPPSDFQLLKTINDRHRTDYLARIDPTATGSAVMLPIDIPAGDPESRQQASLVKLWSRTSERRRRRNANANAENPRS
jgi:hypothetical protein